MDVREIILNLVQQHFGYFPHEVTPTFNIYSTILSIDELSDFIVDIEESFGIDIDESKLPIESFAHLVEYVELLVNTDKAESITLP